MITRCRRAPIYRARQTPVHHGAALLAVALIIERIFSQVIPVSLDDPFSTMMTVCAAACSVVYITGVHIGTNRYAGAYASRPLQSAEWSGWHVLHFVVR